MPCMQGGRGERRPDSGRENNFSLTRHTSSDVCRVSMWHSDDLGRWKGRAAWMPGYRPFTQPADVHLAPGHHLMTSTPPGKDSTRQIKTGRFLGSHYIDWDLRHDLHQHLSIVEFSLKVFELLKENDKAQKIRGKEFIPSGASQCCHNVLHVSFLLIGCFFKWYWSACWSNRSGKLQSLLKWTPSWTVKAWCKRRRQH